VLDRTGIVPNLGFDDYEAKHSKGASKHAVLAPHLPFVYQEARRSTLAAHCALGCRGVSRADVRYGEPGMTETSGVPELAACAGLTCDELVQWMVEDASLGR
jgi:D-alanine-D-alanine ligase